MDFKDIDKVIESQVKFVKDNSNSVSNRIQILNSLLISIKQNESKIYEALKQDLNKHEFESFLSEILLVKKEIKLFIRKLRSWSKKKTVSGSILNFPSRNYLIPEPYGNVLIMRFFSIITLCEIMNPSVGIFSKILFKSIDSFTINSLAYDISKFINETIPISLMPLFKFPSKSNANPCPVIVDAFII